MNEQALKTVIAFNSLPENEEIKEVKRQYMNDEISSFELFSVASKYLEHKNYKAND